jgi:hypothetical protein
VVGGVLVFDPGCSGHGGRYCRGKAVQILNSRTDPFLRRTDPFLRGSEDSSGRGGGGGQRGGGGGAGGGAGMAGLDGESESANDR